MTEEGNEWKEVGRPQKGTKGRHNRSRRENGGARKTRGGRGGSGGRKPRGGKSGGKHSKRVNETNAAGRGKSHSRSSGNRKKRSTSDVEIDWNQPLRVISQEWRNVAVEKKTAANSWKSTKPFQKKAADAQSKSKVDDNVLSKKTGEGHSENAVRKKPVNEKKNAAPQQVHREAAKPVFSRKDQKHLKTEKRAPSSSSNSGYGAHGGYLFKAAATVAPNPWDHRSSLTPSENVGALPRVQGSMMNATAVSTNASIASDVVPTTNVYTPTVVPTNASVADNMPARLRPTSNVFTPMANAFTPKTFAQPRTSAPTTLPPHVAEPSTRPKKPSVLSASSKAWTPNVNAKAWTPSNLRS